MAADDTIAALLDEAEGLGHGNDNARLLAIYEQAATLVDRQTKPKKWAALRHMAGVLAFAMPGRLEEALAAFRDSRPHWDPLAEHVQWAEATSYIGWTLFALARMSPPDSEEAIDCLEATLADYPDDTPRMLALLYSVRVVGDPFVNWQKHVFYLQAALQQAPVDADPVRWALLRNDLALAAARQPDGDFAALTERRIGAHREALDALATLGEPVAAAAEDARIRIAIDASEAWLNRIGSGDAAGDRAEAARLAAEALADCGPATPRELQSMAVMASARVLMSDAGKPSRNDCEQALALCDRADGLVDPATQPVLAATALKFRAVAHRRLMQLGESDHLEPMLASVDAAVALLDPVLQGSMRRSLMLLSAEGLVDAADYARAVSCLADAEREGERSLAEATTRAGRLECIFDLRDASSLLGWCRLQTHDITGAVEAIDRGKGRLWSAGKSHADFAEIRRCVPNGGALLFAVFAPKGGAVVVVSEAGERVAPLPGFGRDRLNALLFGELPDPASDSWLARLIRRRDEPRRWADRIDSVGATLYDAVWAPVIATLQAMGVGEGAELVWFAQADLGVLPLHAAWTTEGARRRWITDRHPVRYVISARCLLANAARPAGPAPARTLLVCNPASDLPDLPYAGFEAAWLGTAAPAGLIETLSGQEARRAAVLAALPTATLAHFATHGSFDVADPMRSHLVLAGGEPLSLEAMLPVVAGSSLQTVVLSACETAAAPSWRKADEMIGFPGALLEHGVSTVIASLWPVDDFATAVLLGRFYREWQPAGNRSAAEALRTAQCWLRDVTAGELRELMAELEACGGAVGELAAEAGQSLSASADDARLFAHPQFWAAFTVSGA